MIIDGATTLSGGYGGGIYLAGTNVTILDNVIQGNAAWAASGGIACTNSDNVKSQSFS